VRGPSRKAKAALLLLRVQRGPSLGSTGVPLSPDEAESRTRLWLETWVEPLVRELVPELRAPKRQGGGP
jgi:hypothetical protein